MIGKNYKACSLSIPNCNALFCLLFQKPRDRVGKRSTITAEVSSTTSSLGKWLWINFDAQRRLIVVKNVLILGYFKNISSVLFLRLLKPKEVWSKIQIISFLTTINWRYWWVSKLIQSHIPNDPLLICTWFLKNQVVKIKLEKLDF